MSLNDFEILKLLGKGSFGTVYLVKRKKDSQIYAMKRINLPKSPMKEKEAALNEIRLLASLSHPNIIGYKETFCDIHTGDLCIIMEYADGGDLSKRISYNKSHHLRFMENMIWKWLIQILNGVVFLHSNNIMHRDLKSANIFLKTNNILKIGDLNVSKLIKNTLAKTKTGTPYYLAPEVWEDFEYDYKCDIWSIGCIIYELCTLAPPFRATNLRDLYRNIKKGYYDPISEQYSDELKTVIKWMLNTNPSQRKSAKEIYDSNIIQKKIKEGSGKELLQIISQTKENYKLIGTIKMPRNIKDVNKVLPHERYKMGENDPFEIMKKTIKLIESKDDKKDNKNIIQPLNNYNRELAEQIKKNNANKKNNNDENNNNMINMNIKPVIIKSDKKNNNKYEYNIFNKNKNKNDANIVNLNFNDNNKEEKNNNINNNINNSSKKNSIKPSVNNSNMSAKKNQIGADTRRRIEKEKFNEIKNEFKRPLSNKNKYKNKIDKGMINQNKNAKKNINNNHKQRPPSGQPRYNPYNIKNSNNVNNNVNNNVDKNKDKNNINNNSNNKKSSNKRPLSHYNNRIVINNNIHNNIYLNNNNNNNNNYFINNNKKNIISYQKQLHNNDKIKKYEIKNNLYYYGGQNFDMRPYKYKNKANYNKMDINKYKEDNKNKFKMYLNNGNSRVNNYNYNAKYNDYNKLMKAQRERVNPSLKQKQNNQNNFVHREGKYRKY